MPFMNNKDEPINPQTALLTHTGLNKREYFAAMAMQGLLAGGISCDNVQQSAISFADNLLEDLEKEDDTTK